MKLVHGLKVDNKIHVSREKEEKKYISNADLMITSSDFNKQSLVIKYPKLRFLPLFVSIGKTKKHLL